MGRLAVAAACLLALVGSGCTPSDPPPPPPATPTSTPSPTPTENAQERDERLAYEAAEKSYRAVRAEYGRINAAGGASSPTEVMRTNAGGPYLAELTQAIRAYQAAKYHTRGKEVIGYVRQSGYSRESLLLSVCEDDSAVALYSATGKRVSGSDTLELELEVRRVSAQWKVWSGKSSKKVEACN